MENKVILSASSNNGIGLWTSICVAFCSILGKKSKNYQKKQDKVLNDANKQLMAKYKSAGGISLSDYRVVWESKLSVTVSALATVNKEVANTIQSSEMVCPRCGAPIDDEMLFCGECGEKLK